MLILIADRTNLWVIESRKPRLPMPRRVTLCTDVKLVFLEGAQGEFYSTAKAAVGLSVEVEFASPLGCDSSARLRITKPETFA